MVKFAMLAGVALLGVSLAGATAANAYTILGTEDPVNGWVGNILQNSFPGTSYLVASDGESYFDPFGAGFDTSDGLNFSGVGFTWNQAAGSTWTNIGFQTWVIPAVTSCGSENEPDCEPVGHFVSPNAWNAAALGTYVLLENPADGGGISDIIKLYNDANGANVLFSSDPSLIPETSTWAMMLLGFAGLGFAGYRARKQTAALAV
jgi:hypothetical protein